MSGAEEPEVAVKLTRGTLIPIGAAVSVLVGAIAMTVSVTTKLVRIEASIEQVHRDVRVMERVATKAGEDRWTETEMRTWAELLQARNPDLRVPVPPR